MSGFIAESPNAKRQVEQQGRVRDLPRANFILFYHPAEWQLDAHGELTPSISHMSLAPGAGADERGDFTRRRAELLKRGYVEIPHDVMGEHLPDYVAQYTNHRGKAVCRTVFQIPYNDATGNTKWRVDIDAVRAFIAFLRKRGLVRPPTSDVIEGLLVSQERILERLAGVRPADNEAAHRRHQEKIRRCERAIANLREELGRSHEVYGVPASPARSAVLQLLQGELARDEGAAEVARRVRSSKGGKRKGKAEPEPEPPPLTPLDGGLVAEEDEEDDL